MLHILCSCMLGSVCGLYTWIFVWQPGTTWILLQHDKVCLYWWYLMAIKPRRLPRFQEMGIWLTLLQLDISRWDFYFECSNKRKPHQESSELWYRWGHPPFCRGSGSPCSWYRSGIGGAWRQQHFPLVPVWWLGGSSFFFRLVLRHGFRHCSSNLILLVHQPSINSVSQQNCFKKLPFPFSVGQVLLFAPNRVLTTAKLDNLTHCLLLLNDF